MPLMTSQQYVESLAKMERKIWFQGKRIKDPINHPLLVPSRKCLEETYDMALMPEYEDLLTATREACRINLVNQVAPPGGLMEAVDRFCEPLLHKSANVLDFIKRAVDYGSEMDLRSAAQYEAALFGLISGTSDKREGMAAFLEKRPPAFCDR